MARTINRLTTRKAETIGTGFHADGNGLYLRVDPTGARRWVFVFFWRTKRTEMGLGGLADIPLAEARERARQARLQVREGVNPIEAREAVLAPKIEPTFGQIADELIAALSPSWKNEKHAQQWRTTLTVDAAPLRPKKVAHITTDDVLAVLNPIWHVKPETASRLQGRIERVMDAAKVKGHRKGENPARWKGHLSLLLRKRKKSKRRHHPALPYARMKEFFGPLRRSESISALALEFTILTAARTTEVLLARGSEIDLTEAVWTVPAERMKMARPHRVPLSGPALSIARARMAKVGDGLLFPGLKKDRPMSNNSMAKLLKLWGYDEFTVHGFRSSFRDWVPERTQFPRELAEISLAHLVGDDTEQSYWRSDMLEARHPLMEAWAAYCDPAGSAKILNFA